MSLTLVGSHLCPDTLYALNQLCARKVDFTFRNDLIHLFDPETEKNLI